MKKLFFLFGIFLCIHNALTGAYTPPIRTMVIPYAAIPFNIDGIDNEPHWSEEQTTNIFNPTGYSGPFDFTFTFKIAWDENYLYLFGRILDDFNCSWEWGLPNQWTYDNVEVYFDLDTSGSGEVEAYDSNTYSLRINRGVDSIGNDYGRNCKRSDHLYSWANTTDGWIFETALAWKFVLGPNQKPEDIMEYVDGTVRSGFDIHGADSDTPGPDHRDCQTAWDDDEPCPHPDTDDCNSWNNRNIFGIVNFQPKYYTELHELSGENPLIYPNPTKGIIKYNCKLQGNIEILNSVGQAIFTSTINDNQIDISHLSNGIYFFQIADRIYKVIKQ